MSTLDGWSIARVARRASLLALVLASTLSVSGCGQSGKELALERGEADAGELHQQRLIRGQTDR